MSPDYTMRTPCSNCPFRREGGIRLHPGRVRELANHDGDFYCHKTARGDHEGEEGDDYRATGDERMCAGYLIFRYRNGNPGQMQRIAERLRLLDGCALMEGNPAVEEVFGDLQEMLAAQKEPARV